MPQLIPTAEPFFFPGNDIGCLLVHGFTGAPKEMRWMGETLNKQGFTVLGVRLAGHATHPADMIRSNYTDWLACVEDGYTLLSGSAKRIYIMGLSMGGTLSLTAAAYLPVKGIVAMSTPYKLPDDERLEHIDNLAQTMPFMPKSDEAPGSGWFDPQAWQEHVSYPDNPTRSIGQLNLLLGEMRAALPQVKAPVLLIHSRDDKTVEPASMPAIYHDLGSPDKEMLWIDHSGHVITRDAQRETVFRAAADFVHKLEKTA
jgi:carboxylesterase